MLPTSALWTNPFMYTATKKPSSLPRRRTLEIPSLTLMELGLPMYYPSTILGRNIPSPITAIIARVFLRYILQKEPFSSSLPPMAFMPFISKRIWMLQRACAQLHLHIPVPGPPTTGHHRSPTFHCDVAKQFSHFHQHLIPLEPSGDHPSANTRL